jgi:hypothetical protein
MDEERSEAKIFEKPCFRQKQDIDQPSAHAMLISNGNFMEEKAMVKTAALLVLAGGLLCSCAVYEPAPAPYYYGYGPGYAYEPAYAYYGPPVYFGFHGGWGGRWR